MKHLFQAVRMSLRYKYSLIISILCSAMVAVFWGANITAVYPFVEVVFQGQTLHEWVEHQTDQVNRQLSLVDGELLNADIPPSSAATDAEIDAPGPMANDGRVPRKPHNPLADLSRPDLEKKLRHLERAKDWIDRYAPRDPFRTLLAIVAFLFVGTLIKSAFRIGSLMTVTRVAERTTVDLRNEYFRSLLSDHVTMTRQAGDAAARVGGDVGAIGAAVQTMFGRSVQEPLKMLTCLVLAALVNWRLLLFSLLACPLASFLLLALAKSIRRASLRAFDQKCLLMGRMLQTFQGLTIVKAYNMESHERRRFWQHTQHVYDEQMKITWYEGLIRSNNELLGIGVICISALAGGYLVLEHKTSVFGIPLAAAPMDFGQIMLFYAFLIGCTDPLRKSGDVYGSVQRGAAAAERIMPFLSANHVPVDMHKTRIQSAKQPIIFENVHFHYVKSQPVVRGVSFRVVPNETLAIIGANGCGKSTLINLLLRFHDPTRGRILLGGMDIQEIRRKNLRRRIALVTQKAILFNDSVYNNITYGTRHASREQVIAAAIQAHAHEFIETKLAQGYDTLVGDGGNRLSGGQQQRIALARAILRNPDILILDEAASQIDPKSEQLITESLKEFVRNRTTIMITHRMSTLELADRILLMYAGRIVDIGTHEALMSRCPIYQSLRQSPVKLTA